MRISDWSSDVCSSDLDLDIHRLQAARERSVLRIIVAGETDGIALGVLDQFLIRERHRLHLIERKAGSICTHLHFLVTKRLKDCTALPDDGEKLRSRSSPTTLQLKLMVTSLTNDMHRKRVGYGKSEAE